eukprot:gene9314-9396_t
MLSILATTASPRVSAGDALQRHDPRIDQHLAGIFEVDGHPAADHRLHLSLAPVRLTGMAHPISGLKPGVKAVVGTVIVHAKAPAARLGWLRNMRMKPMRTQAAGMQSLALAEAMACRMLHDLAGLVGTVSGALELAEEVPAMRDEALPVAADAARVLAQRLRLMRAAWGCDGPEMDGGTLRALAGGIQIGRRVRLDMDDLAADRQFGEGGRLLLNLTMASVEAVGGEGTVTLRTAEGGDVLVLITGPRAAWPVGFAGLLIDPAATIGAVLQAEPSALQAPLSALISHAAGIRVHMLHGAGASQPAPLLVALGTAE